MPREAKAVTQRRRYKGEICHARCIGGRFGKPKHGASAFVFEGLMTHVASHNFFKHRAKTRNFRLRGGIGPPSTVLGRLGPCHAPQALTEANICLGVGGYDRTATTSMVFPPLRWTRCSPPKEVLKTLHMLQEETHPMFEPSHPL